MPRPSKAAGSVALVTGANRGIGLAFVRELTARGAKKVYAGVRDPDALTDELAGLPAEVVPLDVTDCMAVDARARYARDPVRYERGMTKLLKATVMDTGR
jgi:NAD(P)-dependent dehydrogenase (short-subunit alcohol dehydrogenase family)